MAIIVKKWKLRSYFGWHQASKAEAIVSESQFSCRPTTTNFNSTSTTQKLVEGPSKLSTKTETPEASIGVTSTYSFL